MPETYLDLNTCREVEWLKANRSESGGRCNSLDLAGPSALSRSNSAVFANGSPFKEQPGSERREQRRLDAAGS